MALAEVTPAFHMNNGGPTHDTSSVYSEPAYRYQVAACSVYSEPPYRPPSPQRCRDCHQSMTLAKSPSEHSLPSLDGMVALAAGMERYASLRHPDGASDPNLKKTCENLAQSECDDAKDGHKQGDVVATTDSKSYSRIGRRPQDDEETDPLLLLRTDETLLSDDIVPNKMSKAMAQHLPPLPLLLMTPDAYDSAQDSTPRTSKHSGMSSRRAESGYHSIVTAPDSDGSQVSRASVKVVHARKPRRDEKTLCHWLRNPFNCTYPDTEGEVSDF